jgi:flagellar biosynthesis chaperone FliJ
MINTPTSISWHAAYRQFLTILEETLSENQRASTQTVSELVNQKINDLYAQHKGEPAWDEAYRRWHESDDEGEEAETP